MRSGSGWAAGVYSVGLRIGEAGRMLPHSPLTYVAVHLELPAYLWPFGTTDNGIFLSLELTVIIVLLIAKVGLICGVSRVYLSSYPSFPTLPFSFLEPTQVVRIGALL